MTSLDRRSVLRWVGAISASALGAGATLVACSSDTDTVAGRARSGQRQNYVAGDGSVESLAEGQRGEAVVLNGTTLEGKPWSMADATSQVLVINVWGSWCPPCIEETPALQRAWEKVQSGKKKVAFLGLDKLEAPETGLAYQRAHGVSYSSLAYDGGVPILALQGKASATPTTLVLDPAGRIAARVSGPVSTSTLLGLIDDVFAKGS